MPVQFVTLVDFSEYTEPLLRLVKLWSSTYNAEIHIVHQVAGSAPALADPESKKKIIEFETREATDQLYDLIRKMELPRHKTRFTITSQNLIRFLEEQLATSERQIVFTGLKGTGLLKQLFIGSTTVQLIDALHHIIVTVPSHAHECVPEKLIIAIHEKFPINTTAFDFLLDVVHPSLQKLEFITVAEEAPAHAAEPDFLTETEQLYSNRFATARKNFSGKEAFDTIKAYLKNQSNSFLVVQEGSRTLRDQLFRKFLINELVYDGSIPMIIIPK
ncbi:MAG: hypothetical protein ACK4E8_03005 [Lacibacter sp.]